MKPGAHGTDLAEFARYILQHGPHKTLPTPRRVRVVFNHTYIVDTTRTLMVWEHEYYPQFYVKQQELRNCVMKEKEKVDKDGKAMAAVVELTILAHDGVEEAKTDRAVYFSEHESLGPLAGMVRLEFGSMDQWLEEDMPIYVHPKDPYKRVDILPSQRHIEIKIDGHTVAESGSSMHLLETGLPTRYYMPLASVDQALLRKSDLVTKCPYKGEAEYYHVVAEGSVHENVVWYYRHPTHESAAVAGMVCFYNEKVDVILGGELQQRPKTPFG